MKVQSRLRKTVLAGSLFSAVTFGASGAQAASYVIDITTGYNFSNPFAGSTFLGGGGPGPDTGFVDITNSGSTTFIGTLGTVAVSNFGGDASFSTSVTLAPGQSDSIAIGNESSNVGGFNGPFGVAQPGVQIFLNGLFNGQGASLSVFDSNIHSGSPRTNPYGVTLDNYVLQGGDPFGRDTGDAFETSQSLGHYTFTSATPLPAALPLMGSVLGGGFFAGMWRRRRNKGSAAAAA
jgi:hypothetical protein